MTSRSDLIAAVLVLALASPSVARAQEGPEDPAVLTLRERFREGFDKYKAGQYGEAILVWSPIYKELGPAKGYRLAFNLARAYEQIHDETKAADHFEAYLDEVEARQNTGENLEPIVIKQREEAETTLAALRAKLVRLRFRGEAVLVTLDRSDVRMARGVSYVTPGKHTIVWRPATADETRIEVNPEAGAVLDLEAPRLPEKLIPVTTPTITWETRTERPFPKTVLYVGAGVTALSFILPPLLYANALGTKDDYDANMTSETRDRYYSQQTVAYASWAIPALLGTATIALALYWFYGEKTVRTPVGVLGPSRF